MGLSQAQAKLAGARVRLLRRFGALSGPEADGYGSVSPWLMAKAAAAIERHRRQRPDADADESRFGDRCLRVGVTFGGAAVLRGDLTPECAAAVRAVLESLGKKRGREDERAGPQRFHDALQEGCELLLRARLTPDRAGADTQVVAHIPLSQLRDMPGAGDLEDAWPRARLGEDGYLSGKDAEAAACDAQTVPVVTGHPDMDAIDQVIGLARAGAEVPGTRDPGDPAAWRALRYAVARLAIDFVSGPAGVAAVLRQGLLGKPWNTPVAAAGHRLGRLRPPGRPPRGHPARPALRVARRLRPPGQRLRRAPHPAQGRRRRDFRG